MGNNDSLTKAKVRLSTSHYLHAGEEQDDLTMLLKEVEGTQREELLRWVLEDHVTGFVDARKMAGLELVRESPSQTWNILKKLLNSDNPDDRDTASEILQEINTPDIYPLMKPLLYDRYPYIRFDACDFLKDIYRDEVIVSLRQMLSDPDERTRNAAKKRLLDMKIDLY
jgi:hypothetical protein